MEAIRIKWILVIWIACCGIARAEQAVSLAWDPVPETNVVGYYIRYGRDSLPYEARIDVTNGTAYTVTGLSNGLTYYFAVTAYDRDRLESDSSNIVTNSLPRPVGPPLQFHLAPNFEIRINFPVVPGQAYELQATRDLLSWVPVWRTVGDTSGSAEFKYVGATIYDHRFYRLLVR